MCFSVHLILYVYQRSSLGQVHIVLDLDVCIDLKPGTLTSSVLIKTESGGRCGVT